MRPSSDAELSGDGAFCDSNGDSTENGGDGRRAVAVDFGSM